MTADLFKKNLLALFSNFGQDPDADRIRFITMAVEKAIGFSHDWGQVFLRIASNEKFFPPAAVIIEYVNKTSKNVELTNKQKAVECVDRYILYLKSHLKHEEVSEFDHTYYKKRFGADRHAVQSGAIDLNYRRKEWIDICEIDFEVFEKTGERSWLPKNYALPEKVANLLTWGKNVDEEK